MLSDRCKSQWWWSRKLHFQVMLTLRMMVSDGRVLVGGCRQVWMFLAGCRRRMPHPPIPSTRQLLGMINFHSHPKQNRGALAPLFTPSAP